MMAVRAVPEMSVRRRLRSLIETRRVSEVCWRCVPRSARYNSTSPLHIDDGPDNRQAFAGQQISDVTSPGLREAGKPRIRKHVSDEVNNTAQYSNARAREDSDTGNLPQQIIKSGDELFDDALRAFFSERNARNDAEQDTVQGDGVSRMNPSLSFEDKQMNVKNSLVIGHEQQRLEVRRVWSLQRGKPLPRIKRCLTSYERHAEPGLGESAERKWPISDSQSHTSVSGDVSPIVKEHRLGTEKDTIHSPGRQRRRKAAMGARSTLRGDDVLDAQPRKARSRFRTARYLAIRKNRTDPPLVRRIPGLQIQKTFPDGPATTALTMEQSKKREEGSHQLRYLNSSTLRTEKKAFINKPFSRNNSLETTEMEGNGSGKMQPSSGPSVETSISREASCKRRTRGPLVTANSDALAEDDPSKYGRRIPLEPVESQGDFGVETRDYYPRNRHIRKGSVRQMGGIIRRVAKKEDHQGNPNNTLDDLDLVLEKFSEVSKSYSEEGTGLPQSSLRASPPSGPGQSWLRPKTATKFRIMSGAGGTTAADHCHPRFASTLTTQYPDVDHRPLLAANSTYQSGNQNASETIREHLKAWKAMQGDETGSGWNAHIDSRYRPEVALNTVTQSAGGGEDLTEFAPDEDLDIELQISASSEDTILEMLNPQLYLRRGDLVELGVGYGSILGIFINETNDLAQIYTERGAWHQLPPKFISFSVPRVVSPNGLSGLLQYLPSQVTDSGTANGFPCMSNVPRNIGFPLIEKMVKFLRASDAIYREHADRLNRAYEILSKSDCEGQLSVSLEDAAMQILQKRSISDLTPPMLLVVHRVLNSNQNILREHKLHRMTPIFKILPRTTIVRADAVRDWSRAYQDNIVNEATESPFVNADRSLEVSANPIAAFAAKARKIVAFNRQNRPLSSNGSIGRSLTKIKLDEYNSTTWKASEEQQEPFNIDDQQILSFLDLWSASALIKKTSSLCSVGPMILRATGLYEDFYLSRATGLTLLQELGVVKPWDRFSLFHNSLGLPGHDPNHPANILRDQAHESLSHLPVPLHDSMAKLRKDWGNLTVFCIDGEDTLTRDDGISLEPVDGDPSSCWLHVHTANPSAFLSPDSPVARYAHHATASVYFPEHMYPMMDAKLTQDHFSLANGRPCLTFSAKISAEGDIVEKSITHGIVNDVRHLSLDQVRQALATSSHEVAGEDRVSLLRVGQDVWTSGPSKALPTNPEAVKDLSSSAVDTLRELQRVSMVLSRRRQRAGAVSFGDFDNSHTVPRVYISAAESAGVTFHNHQSRCIIGDPIISIDHAYREVREVQEMVMECMILAGQICGLWCSERNIPVIYRGVARNPHPEVSPEAYRTSVLDPAIAARGYADQKTWLTYMSLLGKVFVSSHPLEHVALGVPVYCKSTSPLRRYGDIFTHWQIEAALRHEHATGKSLLGSPPATYDGAHVLPFSRHEVDDVARRMWTQERKIITVSSEASNHWMLQALHRAFYFDEAPLPAILEFTVKVLYNDAFTASWGILTLWGKAALIKEGRASEQEGGYRVGDVWEGQIAKVTVFGGGVIMEPVRLIRRKQGRSGPPPDQTPSTEASSDEVAPELT